MLNRRGFFASLAAAAAAPAALVLSRKSASASIVRAVGEGRRNIPNNLVTDQDGKTYHFYDDLVKGKTVMFNFFYADCKGICPRQTSALLRIQAMLSDRVGKDIFIYSVSLKPEIDKPKHLKEYAVMHGIKPNSGWLLLNARRKDMEIMRERLGFKDSDPVLDADINQHTGILRFGSDINDRWSGYPLLGKAETIAEMVRQLDPDYVKKPLFDHPAS